MTDLTREQVETMFGITGGTRLSKCPFEIPSEMVRHILDTDASLRSRLEASEAAKWVQQTDTHSKLCIALQQLAVMTQESADAKAQLAQESQDSINKQTIIDGLRSERARNECVLIKLKQRLAKMDATLTAIAGYAGENGCCPYGCDTPYIAQQALFKDHHDI